MMKEPARYKGTLTNEKLWYARPASEWLEGLPIGTGRLAAMILGTVKRERVALNHEWLWKGVNRVRDTTPCAHLLDEVRRRLLSGDYEAGTRLGNEAFGGEGGISGRPNRVDPYLPAGDLYIEFNHAFTHNYRRELDLAAAQATVSYTADGKPFMREYVAHLVKDLILVRLTAGGKPFNVSVWLDRVLDPECAPAFTGGVALVASNQWHLAMDGRIQNGIAFRVQVAARRNGGTATVRDRRRLEFFQTNEIVLAVNMGTSARGRRPEEECGPCVAPGESWDDLVAGHRAEHSRHYGGLRLDLPCAPPNIPTDQRIEANRAGADDPGLPLLYFNYGRYLLCASSANAELPPNLQGKWNEDTQPALAVRPPSRREPADELLAGGGRATCRPTPTPCSRTWKTAWRTPARRRATCTGARGSGSPSRPTPGAGPPRRHSAGRCGSAPRPGWPSTCGGITSTGRTAISSPSAPIRSSRKWRPSMKAI